MQAGDALHLRIGKTHRHAKRIGRQQRDLVRCVDAFDVEGRICFGIAQRLRLRQCFGKAQPLFAHLAQNEIGGAVDDARHPLDAVGREALAQRLDDGNAHGHRALIRHCHAVLAGGGKDFVAVRGQQRLVGRDHMLARADGGQHPFACGAGAARHFHHHIHIGVRGHQHRVVGQRRVSAHHAHRTGQAAGAHHHQLDAPPRAPRNLRLVARQHAERARAHGANANHAHAQRAGCQRSGVAGLGLKTLDRIAVHRLLQTSNERTNKKTQLPELGFVHSSCGGRESDHQVAAETATCAALRWPRW